MTASKLISEHLSNVSLMDKLREVPHEERLKFAESLVAKGEMKKRQFEEFKFFHQGF